MKRFQIVQAARTMLDVKYHHAGRNPREAVDCIGLVTCVCDVLGYSYQDDIGYSARPDGQLIERIRPFADEIPVLDRKPGDIGVFWLDRTNRLPQHVGIFSDVGLIHVDMHVRKVVEHSLSRSTVKRLITVFRFRGLED